MYRYIENGIFRERMIHLQLSSRHPKLPRILYLHTDYSHVQHLHNRIRK